MVQGFLGGSRSAASRSFVHSLTKRSEQAGGNFLDWAQAGAVTRTEIASVSTTRAMDTARNDVRYIGSHRRPSWTALGRTMAKEPPTVSELRKAAEVTDQEIDAAVDAVLADLAAEAYPLAKGWALDLVKTLRTNTRAAEALTTDKPAWKRNMVRTAILLAHPVKG